MFHTVGLDKYKWVYSHISESYNVFFEKMKALYKANYSTVTFSDALVVNQRCKSVCLTFDDGYLDNWSLVFPILQKYSLRATIFVNPEFVEPREIVRPQYHPQNIDDIVDLPVETYAGFLSWPEIRIMEKSGLVDIQSHALTHTWHFSGPQIVDYWHPGSATESGGPVWMLWNRFPEFKPYYLIDAARYEKKIPYGTIIYEHGKSLETKIYKPSDSGLELKLISYVKKKGGIDFFKEHNWKKILDDIAAAHRLSSGEDESVGHYETDCEYRNRITYELEESKRIIERNLNKRIDSICWPGGGVSDETVGIALDVGYKYFTMPSKWAKKVKNGIYSNMVSRMSSGPRILWKDRFLGYPTGRQFVYAIENANGSKIAKYKGKVLKCIQFIKYILKNNWR